MNLELQNGRQNRSQTRKPKDTRKALRFRRAERQEGHPNRWAHPCNILATQGRSVGLTCWSARFRWKDKSRWRGSTALPRTMRECRVARSRAFSLLEMIGVLAIIAAIAAVLGPPLIKHIDQAVRTRETVNLSAIHDALLLDVRRTSSIPDQANWQSAVDDWSAIPVSQVATNARGYERIYYRESAPDPGLVYTQTVNGTNQPANLRAIVVSILVGDQLNALNCPDPNGGSLSAADFDALWNLPAGSRPNSGLWANWKGAGDDFLVERVNYAPLFHRLVLVNRDDVTPKFTINGSAPVAVYHTPNNNVGWSAYYLDGSVVGLCDTNGTAMTRYLLTRDISFVFEAGSWRSEIMGLTTGNSQADNFANNAADFLASQWYSSAFKGADQQSALVAMYSFMFTYTLWANQNPHFPMHDISSQQQVPEYMLLQSAAGDADNAGLDQITGSQGLLKK